MLISEAITEPKASTTIGAKYCGIQVNCLPKWEHFTFLFQLFSYFFLTFQHKHYVEQNC
jgi:hypothetical protein